MIVSCNLGREDRAPYRTHNGRSCCPHRGGSSVRSSSRPSALQLAAVQSGVAEAKPETRQVPLSLRTERNENLGMPSYEMAGKGTTRDGSGVAPKGAGRVALQGMVVYYARTKLQRYWPARRERLQRIVQWTVGHDDSVARVQPTGIRLGSQSGQRRVCNRRACGIVTRVQLLVDGGAMAQYISAMRGIFLITSEEGAWH